MQINELKTTEHLCLYLILRNHLRTLDGCVRFLKKRFVEFSKQPVLTGTTSVQPAECAPALSTKFAFNIFLLLPFLFNCGERNNAEYCKQEDAVTQFRYLSNKLANRACFRSPLSPLRAIFFIVWHSEATMKMECRRQLARVQERQRYVWRSKLFAFCTPVCEKRRNLSSFFFVF